MAGLLKVFITICLILFCLVNGQTAGDEDDSKNLRYLTGCGNIICISGGNMCPDSCSSCINGKCRQPRITDD
jgi:hypothetical protein